MSDEFDAKLEIALLKHIASQHDKIIASIDGNIAKLTDLVAAHFGKLERHVVWEEQNIEHDKRRDATINSINLAIKELEAKIQKEHEFNVKIATIFGTVVFLFNIFMQVYKVAQ